MIKLRDVFLLESKAPIPLNVQGGECPMCGAGGDRGKGFLYYDDGRPHPVECAKCKAVGTPQDFDFDLTKKPKRK